MSVVEPGEYEELITFYKNGLRESILEWIDRKNLSSRSLLSLIESVLDDVGKLWDKGEIALIQVYIASKITEEIAVKVVDQRKINIADLPKARIVLGTLEEDNHSLGKNLIKRFLMPFFEVYDLGIDVKIDSFVQKAREVEADIIAVSALMMNSVVKIFDLRELIDSTEWSKKPFLLVGGAPFTMNPTLSRDVGADAYALSAFDVVHKCVTLLERRE
ncbi:MAG: B12-binding domain-containing protein [Candidatus Odinarchaeota archaeon]